jgi:5-methylthioadenosine/S-adenosylhomocysteine deaminase
MTILRGIADDKALLEWLQEDVWPLEGQFCSDDFCKEGTLCAIAEMIRCGTTCFNDMYFFADSSAEVVLESGIRAVLGTPILEFPTRYASSADEYLSKGEKVVQKYKDVATHDLLQFSVAPHAPYTVSDASLVKCKEQAEEMGSQIHIHLHETALETKSSCCGEGPSKHLSDQKCSPLANLKRLGLSSERLIAVHMTSLTDDEIAQCAADKINVVHCPNSNMKLASGFCPVSKLLAAGVNVAIGTDGCSSNNSLDMLRETRMAAMIAKGYASDPTVAPAAVALQMATLNGAKALAMDGKVGSIEVGKYADMAAVSMDSIEMTPIYSAISHLVYVADRSNVSHVWVAGKCLMENRKLTTIDESKVKASMKEWQAKIVAFKSQPKTEEAK